LLFANSDGFFDVVFDGRTVGLTVIIDHIFDGHVYILLANLFYAAVIVFTPEVLEVFGPDVSNILYMSFFLLILR
jgi:hypothetical protein